MIAFPALGQEDVKHITEETGDEAGRPAAEFAIDATEGTPLPSDVG